MRVRQSRDPVKQARGAGGLWAGRGRARFGPGQAGLGASIALSAFGLIGAEPAAAHVAEQAFVLLLPTGAYTAAGVAVVALTILALFALPDRIVMGLFAWRAGPERPRAGLKAMTSLISMAALAGLILLGLTGPRDPLSNLMPLMFWTIGWVGIVSLSGVIGDLWSWINPWTGLYRLLGPIRPVLTLPAGLGHWPAALLLIAFSGFLLADIAPDDPARLATLLALYWLAVMAGLVLFGPDWLEHVELGRAILGAYGRLAPAHDAGAPAGLGGPGWRLIAAPPLRAAGVFALVLLATGSFDGLNETFWWLARIGVNPLEFPGRSAVVAPTLAGLVAAVAALAAIFAACLWLGLRLALPVADRDLPFGTAFNWLALSLLPIALGYHIAHYLTSFLVLIQYSLAALSDPLARGDDFLGLQPFFVTTGFFNRIETVRVIWLSQAGAVVLGHVWSVLLSHRIALKLLGPGRAAALVTLPLSILMIAYTFLGLWLLAAPRGA